MHDLWLPARSNVPAQRQVQPVLFVLQSLAQAQFRRRDAYPTRSDRPMGQPAIRDAQATPGEEAGIEMISAWIVRNDFR